LPENLLPPGWTEEIQAAERAASGLIRSITTRTTSGAETMQVPVRDRHGRIVRIVKRSHDGHMRREEMARRVT